MCIHSLYHHMTLSVFFFFFFNDTATTEIYTLSLHDALPILSVVFQPIDGIERDPPLSPDLEVEVRAAVARLAAHVPDDLALEHALAFRYGGVAQIAVEAVVAAPVVEQHRGEVCPERTRETHGAAGGGAHRRPERRGESDAVPGDPRGVRAHGSAEPVNDLAVDRPVQLAQVGGPGRPPRPRGRPRGRAPAHP